MEFKLLRISLMVIDLLYNCMDRIKNFITLPKVETYSTCCFLPNHLKCYFSGSLCVIFCLLIPKNYRDIYNSVKQKKFN